MNDVRERPIVMSGDEVRAILDGRKTQFRRPVKPQPQHKIVKADNGLWYDADCINPGKLVRCPFGVPGDRLWVRERYCILDRDGWIDPSKPRDELFATNPYPRRNAVAYGDFAHDPDSERCRKELGYKWRPSIHMPRWASRITREITDIRVQRVQEISEADAIAEGFTQKLCAEIFDRAAGKHEARDRCWLEHSESGEEFYLKNGGTDFCHDCAVALLRKNKKYDLRGDCGSAGETDGPAYCDQCGEALLVSLTEYGVDRELGIEDDPDGKEPQYYSVRDVEARIAHTIADGIGDLRERHLGRLAQIGFATALDSIYGPGAWDRNDWCWVVTFSVVKGTKERT